MAEPTAISTTHTGFKPPRSLGINTLTFAPRPGNARVTVPAKLLGDSGLVDDDAAVLASKRNFKIENLRDTLFNLHTLSAPISHPIGLTQTTIGALLEHVEKEPPVDFSLTSLDQYNLDHPVCSACLRAIVINSKPRYLEERLGRELITWALANLTNPEGSNLTMPFPRIQNFPAFPSYLNYMEVDTDNFNLAARISGSWFHPRHQSRSQTTVVNYNLLACHDYTVGQLPPIGAFISHPDFQFGSKEEAAKTHGAFALSRIREYNLLPLHPLHKKDHGVGQGREEYTRRYKENGKNYEVTYTNYSDTPLGFLLTWKGIPQATASVLASDPRTLMIVQMQGMKGFRREIIKGQEGKDFVPLYTRTGARGLIGLRWEELLVAAIENYAKLSGFEMLGIIGADKNPWVGSTANSKIFSYENANLVYDHLAVKLKFQRCPVSGAYYRKIEA